MNQNLSFRVARESQLLAEEKWLIEALTKIRKQRNCLQIERLHLESLKVKLKSTSGEDSTKSKHDISTSDEAISSTVNLMQNIPGTKCLTNRIEFEVPLITDNETSCNSEQLDLFVSKSVFSQDMVESAYNMEEYEEDEDDCDTDNVVIDIHMLMNNQMQ